MRKLNYISLMLFFLALSNLSFGQQNRNVYTIGTTFTTGSGANPQNTCYPATPLPIRPDGNNNNTSADVDTNTSNSHLFTSSPIADLETIIENAYARGFRKFYFQEGLYVVSQPIDLNGLNGITIEGAGARTTFKPASTTLEAIFKISNNYNSKIMNLNMDLKTTLNCGAPTDTADANTGIKIGTQVGRCLFEGLFFRSYIGSSNATMKSTSPILVELASAQESDWNTFNNIHYQRCTGGIVLNNNGVFNHNKFSNIHFEYAKIGIDFQGSNGTFEGNVFSDIDMQAYKATIPNPNYDPGNPESSPTLPSPDNTTDFVKNIKGDNNTFQNFQIADYAPGSGFVFSIAAGAKRNTITNCEVAGSTINSVSESVTGWYQDLGTGTHFVGNANTNRTTDYIVKDINDLYYEGKIETGKTQGQVQNDPKFNFLTYKNFNRVIFKNDPFETGIKTNQNGTTSIITTKMFTNSVFSVQDYSNINIGNYAEFSGNGFYGVGTNITGTNQAKSTTNLRGDLTYSTHNNMFLKESYDASNASDLRGKPLESTNANAKKYVITNADGWGKFQWTKIGDLTWNHIAAKNINMSNFALTNVSNLAATPPLAATDPANPENPANTLPGLRLDNTGNVRIGTAAPFTTNPAKLQVDGRVIVGNADANVNAIDSAYKLIVNGRVRVKEEVYVLHGNFVWPDYVFAKDYKLMPLQQVEQHIQQKGHLPNMPSASEVEKEGIPMGDIIIRQQEKIEELTLYLIEMKKQNDDLQKRMEALENNKKSK